jgi:predicted Zn-dependent protease with MMP-like domain
MATFEKGFNEVLFDCIDKAASSILGKDGAYTFYYAIQERHNIPVESFPQKPLVVLEYLKEFLGEAGYVLIEHAIISEIKHTFGIRSETTDIDALTKEAKLSYLSRSF